MALVIGTLLGLFCIAIVAYPFLKTRLGVGTGGAGPSGEQAVQLGDIYDRIRTLQLEYQLGQVPQHLYREQLQEYRLQAAAALRRQVQEQAAAPEWLLEQEILAARGGLRSEGGEAAACPKCRTLPGPGLKVCPECGAELEAPQGRG